MLKRIFINIRTSLIFLVIITLITGLLYPGVVTLLAQTLFPWQANGSFIEKKGTVIGSMLIGQSFTSDKYFWGRPSATIPFPYNAAQSKGANLGPSNPILFQEVKNQVSRFVGVDSDNIKFVPIDLVTTSASGLDPEISPLAAFYQVERIAKARGMNEQDLEQLIYMHIQPRILGLLGEPRVNVLLLNLALDNEVWNNA